MALYECNENFVINKINDSKRYHDTIIYHYYTTYHSIVSHIRLRNKTLHNMLLEENVKCKALVVLLSYSSIPCIVLFLTQLIKINRNHVKNISFKGLACIAIKRMTVTMLDLFKAAESTWNL